MSYLSQLQATIVDNLIISLKNLHIRYQDTHSNPYRPFVIGVTLQKITYSPTDNNWNKGFITLEAKQAQKRSFMKLELSSLCVYHVTKSADILSTRPDWLASLTPQKFMEIMYPFIAHSNYSPVVSDNYLLKPLNAEIRIRRKLEDIESDIPKTSMAILLDEVACTLQTHQYQDLLMLAKVISINSQIYSYTQLRPTISALASPKLWWKYAWQCTTTKVQINRKMKNKRCLPYAEYLKQRAQDKKKYIDLYQHWLMHQYQQNTGKKFPIILVKDAFSRMSIQEIDKMMLEIEDKYNVQQLLLFRCLAERKIQELSKAKQKQGWFEWGVSFLYSSTTVEQTAFLNTLVEYAHQLEDTHTGQINSLQSFELKKCSISLAGRQMNGLLADFVVISLESAVVHRQIKGSLTQIYMALSAFKVTDPFTPIPKFSELVTIKNSHQRVQVEFQVQQEIFPMENNGFLNFGECAFENEPILNLTLQKDKKERMLVNLALQPMEVLYNKFCVQRIRNFFNVAQAMAFYQTIEMQTYSYIQIWRQETQNRIEHIMQNYIDLKLDISISAPVILIPQNPLQQDSSMIVIDLGLLSIKSRDRQIPYSQLITIKASEIQEKHCFDHFEVVVSDINVRFNHFQEPWSLIDRFSIFMEFSKSIVPKDPTLTSLKIKGEISQLTVRASKFLHNLIMQYTGQQEEENVREENKEKREEDQDQQEFFDAEEAVLPTAFNYSYHKEHLVLDFAIKSLELVYYANFQSRQFPILTLKTQEFLWGVKILEGSRLLKAKLGALVLENQKGQEVVFNSKQEIDDLVYLQLIQLFSNHPDYQDSFSLFIKAELLNLNILYDQELISLLDFKKKTPQIPSMKKRSKIKTELLLKNFSFTIPELLNFHISGLNFLYQSPAIGMVVQQVTAIHPLKEIVFFQTLASVLMKLDLQDAMQIYVNSFKLSINKDFIETVEKFYQKIPQRRNSDSQSFTSLKMEFAHPIIEFSHPFNESCVLTDLGSISVLRPSPLDLSISIHTFKVLSIFQEKKEFIINELNSKIIVRGPQIDIKVFKAISNISQSKLVNILEIVKEFPVLKSKQEESNQRNLILDLDLIDFTWNHDSIKSKIQCIAHQFQLRKNSEIVQLRLHQLVVNCLTQYTHQLVLTKQHDQQKPLIYFGKQRNQARFELNSARFFISPAILKDTLAIAKEISELVPESQGQNPKINLQGKVQKLNICIRNDHQTQIDDQDSLDLSVKPKKQYLVLKLGCEYFNKKLEITSLCLIVQRSAAAQSGSQISGYYILHPMNIFYSNQRTEIQIIQIQIGTNYFFYFLDLFKQFKEFLPQNTQNSNPSQHQFILIKKLTVIVSDRITSNEPSFLLDLQNLSIQLLGYLSIKTDLYCNYLNSHLQQWEPFIEPGYFELLYHTSNTEKALEFASTQTLNINITSSLLQTIFNFTRKIQHLGIGREDLGADYLICNQTGQTLQCWNSTKHFYMQNMESFPINFNTYQYQESPSLKFQSNIKKEAKLVNIQVKDLPKIKNIDIDRTGWKVFSVSRAGLRYQVICEVVYKQGANIVTVKSPIQLRNSLRLPLDVRIISPMMSSGVSQDYSIIINIPQSSTVPLPVTSAYFSSIQISIDGYAWSGKYSVSDNFQIIQCTNKPGFYSDSFNAYSIFRKAQYSISEESEVFQMVEYSFQPPMVFQNLLYCPLEYSCETDEKTVEGVLESGEIFHWLYVSPLSSIRMALCIPNYRWTPMLQLETESKTIFQFSLQGKQQVNIIVESFMEEGVLKVVAFAQYWLENHTHLPLYFQYIQNQYEYDIVDLPYTLEGQIIDDSKKKGENIQSNLIAFGEQIKYSEQPYKPWLNYQDENQLGLSSILNTNQEDYTVKMFSIGFENYPSGQACVKIANSHWSPKIDLVGQETSEDILKYSGYPIKAAQKPISKSVQCLYQISMTMYIPVFPFIRTKAIKFSPRFIFINNLYCKLLLSQFEPSSDLGNSCLLQPNQKSIFHWPNRLKGRALCLKPESHGWEWSGQFMIEQPDDFVLRIRNLYTHEFILVHVTITLDDSTLHILLQDTSHMPPYRIENLTTEVIKFHQKQTPENYTLLQQYQVTPYAWDEPLLKKSLRVFVHGMSKNSTVLLKELELDDPVRTQEIQLPNRGCHPKRSLYLEVINQGSTKILYIKQHPENKVQYLTLNKKKISVTINLNHLGLSLVDSKPQELLYLNFERVAFELSQYSSDISIQLQVQSGQIDSQLYSSLNPVLLSSKVQPLLVLKVQKRRTSQVYKQFLKHQVNYFKQVQIGFSPLDINIDGFIIEQLKDFSVRSIQMLSFLQLSSQTPQKSVTQYYYFDRFTANKLTVNLSFQSIPSMLQNSDMSNPLKMLFIIFSNIGNVSLSFKHLKLSHRHLTLDMLIQQFYLHYISQCKSQVLNFVVSSDAIGNPNELMRYISRGVQDFIRFGGTPSGFLRGSKSLLKGTALGASNSVSKAFQSAKKGMQSVYLDNPQRKWKLGMTTARIILAVPTIFVSFASSTSNQMRDLIHKQLTVSRKRPPRSFLMSSVLKEYSYVEALGSYVLSNINKGLYLREGMLHYLIIDETIVLATKKRILCADINEFSLYWVVSLDKVTDLRREGNCLAIYFVDDEVLGYQQSRVLVVGDEDQLKYIHDFLGEACYR